MISMMELITARRTLRTSRPAASNIHLVCPNTDERNPDVDSRSLKEVNQQGARHHRTGRRFEASEEEQQASTRGT